MSHNYSSHNYHPPKAPSYANAIPLGSGYNNAYQPLEPSVSRQSQEYQALEAADSKLKRYIRILRVVSRTFAVILSAATVVPLVITVIKFLQTRNQTITVDGEQRTAWASGTVTIYTFVYLGISAVSLILNSAILIAYCRSVKKANAAASVASWFNIAVIVGHVAIWVAGVIIYMYGKDNSAGKDLWGWTCSSSADAIQSQVHNLDYSKYCTVQTTANYTGIANAITGILSASIYLLVAMRMRSKKRLHRASFKADVASEPMRY